MNEINKNKQAKHKTSKRVQTPQLANKPANKPANKAKNLTNLTSKLYKISSYLRNELYKPVKIVQKR